MENTTEKTFIPILGVVEAGFNTPAEETHLDSVSIDDWLIAHRAQSFMLKVKSDSMEDAGILPGDYVVVERTAYAKAGDIVIVDIDGRWMMGYMRKDSGGFYLEFANERNNILRPHQDFIVSAVVRSVIRKYER